MTTTRGVLYIHSAQSAVCPHVEWAVAEVLGVAVNLDWTPQPAAPAQWRAELSWQGERGTAATLASALRRHPVRYEVTEEPAAGHEGVRYSCTPTLGMYNAVIGVHGDIMVSEARLRVALARAAGDDEERALDDEIEFLLGQPWDDELEPFRHAGDGAPVRWLHQVG